MSAYKAKADNRGRQYGAQVYQFARRRGSRVADDGAEAAADGGGGLSGWSTARRASEVPCGSDVYFKSVVNDAVLCVSSLS